MSLMKSVAGAVVTVALALPASAAAVENGPDPTISNLRASLGDYGYTKTAINGNVSSGFGSATVYAPKGAPGERFGAVAVIPGLTENESAIAWTGPRLASRGFVVVTIQTNNTLEYPFERATELLSALDYLTERSAFKDVVDPNRLAVAGHSMGGGGTFEAAAQRPSLKAAIGFQPWAINGYKENTVPQLIISAQFDVIAPNASHSNKLYFNLPSTTPKYQITESGKDHFLGTQVNVAQASTTIAWLKLFVDGDTRYRQFLCPRNTAAPSGTLSSWRGTCGVF